MSEVIQLGAVRLDRKLKKHLPVIMSWKKIIIDDICRNTTDFVPEWYSFILHTNFEAIAISILSDGPDILGKEDVQRELDTRGLLHEK